MKKLDFEGALHFNEFPPVATEYWETIISSDLKGKDYKEVLSWNAGEGIEALPFYRKEDLNGLLHKAEPLEHAGGWDIVEAIESPDAVSANKEALQSLENGAMGLLFCPDSNFIQSKEDLSQLLQGIHLEYISLHFGSTLSTPETAQWLQEWCEEQQLNSESLAITLNSDAFAHGLRSGKLLSDADLSSFAEGFQGFSIDNTVFGDSGATITQQIAFALAAGNEYLGMDKERAKNLTVVFSTGNHYFLEIAKFRAFKVMWAQVTNEYKLSNADPYIMAATGLWNKSRLDAHNNMLRATTEAMSAAMGGCDAFTLYRYDKHFEQPSEFSSRIARNTQLILQEESYLDKVADPGAGSYYIEKLTDALAEKSWALFQDIEAKGGFKECIKNGFIQQLVSRSKDKKTQAYKDQRKVLVGVNKYTPDDPISNTSKASWPPPPWHHSSGYTFIEIEALSPLNIEEELEKGTD